MRRQPVGNIAVARGSLALAVLAFTPAPLYAADFETAWDLASSLEYNSNAALVSDELAEPVWLGVITPTFTTIRGGDGSRLEIDAGVRIQQSSNLSVSQDREDPNVGLTWSRESARSSLELATRYREASTRITEFEDTGLFLRDGTRTELTAQAGWQFALSPRQTFGLDASYTDAAFDNSVLIDFESANVSLNYGFQATQRLQTVVQLSALRFEPDDATQVGSRPGQSADLYFAGLGLDFQFSERWSAEALASAVRAETTERSDDWNANASVDYQGERLRMSIDAARSTNASGIGEVIESVSVGFTAAWDVSEVSQVGVSAGWRENTGPIENETLSGDLWAERELSPSWSLRAAYTYREQQALFEATGHIVTLSLVFEGDRP